MTILVNHFLWKNALQIIVTLLGIMFLMKGIFLIALPELTLQSSDNPAQVPWVMSIGFILMGIFVGYISFFKKVKTDKIEE
jgi:membrane-bound ClpP family serine protease